MLLVRLLKIVLLLSLAWTLFCPGIAVGQALSTEQDCRNLGFRGERKITPGLLPSMVIRSMDPRVQCGMLFGKEDRSGKFKFDPENDPKAKSFLDKTIKKAKEREAASAQAMKDYAKQREKNIEKERNRKDPAKYLVSLIIDSDIDQGIFRSKLEELKRFGEKQVVSVGAVIVLGMEQRILENVDRVLTDLYSDKPVSKNSKPPNSIDFSSFKPPSQQSLLNSSMTDVEKIIVSLRLRRKGSANVRSMAKEMNIDRLPVWIFYSRDEQIVFDGKQELTGLIDNFGELNYEKQLKSKSPSAQVLKKASGRDFVYIEDRINPRPASLSPDLRIPSRTKGGNKEGLKRF